MYIYLLLLVIIEFVTTKRTARAIVYEGHITVLNQQGRDGLQ